MAAQAGFLSGLLNALHAQAHRQVDGFDVFGQGAKRDVVDAGFGNAAQGALINAAGRFQFGAASGHRNGAAHVIQAEFVEHDDVGARCESLLQLLQALYLNFYGFVRGYLPCGTHRLGDTAAGGDMVFLD